MLVDIFKKKITTKRTPGGREGERERERVWVREGERTGERESMAGF